MELSYAMLARSVELNLDGSVSALGLDFETVPVFALPSPINFFILAKFELGKYREEFPVATADLDVTGPDGTSVLVAPIVNLTMVKANVKPQAEIATRRRGVSPMIIGMMGIPHKDAGEHEVKIEVTLTASDGPKTFVRNLKYFVVKVDG